MTFECLRVVCVARPGACLMSLLRRREASYRFDELLHRSVEQALAVLQVLEHPDPSLTYLLERVAGLVLLSPETILVHHNQDPEGRLWLQGTQQPHEAVAGLELGPGDAVVHEDMRLLDRPALFLGKCAGAL